MKYGLVGEKLGHSFSKDIHRRIADYEYELCEVAKEDIGAFFEGGDFLGINVTIPYKKTVIPYLDHIDPMAGEIGAVNTVVKRDGELYGYNTDFLGMRAMIEHAKISPRDKKVAILGTGGTSRTAEAVVLAMGAREVIKVTSSGQEAAVSYDELYEKHRDVQIIINTTPVGMHPSSESSPLTLGAFHSLSGVIDVIYNPLRTRLILEAEALGIPASGGLYMLVAQAVAAAEIFLNKELGDELTARIYRELLSEKENIVLTGMPSSGKTTIGRELARALGKTMIDTDDEIALSAGISIPEIFERAGEAEFRNLESEAICRAAGRSGVIISTGGGAVLRDENILRLKQSGRIYFLNRSPNLLIPTSDRPLSQSKEALMQRYTERLPVYRRTADEIIDADGSINEIAEGIIKTRR